MLASISRCASRAPLSHLKRGSSARLWRPTQHTCEAPRTSRSVSAMATGGVRHCVVLKLTDSSPETLARIKESLDRLPSIIPQIKAYKVGADAKISEGNADFAITADFASEADFKTYATHPEHVKALTEVVKPVLATRTAVQFKI